MACRFAVASAFAVAVTISIAACSPADEPYFTLSDPTTVTGSAAIGERVLVGIADLAAAAGDRVELVAAAPLSFHGTATVSGWVIRRREIGGGGIGFSTIGALPSGLDFESLARPLSSFAFTTADGPIQVVLAIEANTVGTVAFDGVRISFRVAGAERTETFPTSASIAFDST